MIYLVLALELIAVVFLSFGVEKFWSSYINNRISLFILFPGRMANVLSRALLCLITGATIKNLNIFTFKKNEIEFDKPRIRILGSFLIAAAPIFGCGVIMLFLASVLGGAAGEAQHLKEVNSVQGHISELIEIMKTTLSLFWQQIITFKIPSIIFIASAFILTISMAPSRADLKYLVVGFLVCGAIPLILHQFNISLHTNAFCKTLLDGLWHLITLSLSILTATLSITLIILGLIKGLKLTFFNKNDDGANSNKHKGFNRSKADKIKSALKNNTKPDSFSGDKPPQ